MLNNIDRVGIGMELYDTWNNFNKDSSVGKRFKVNGFLQCCSEIANLIDRFNEGVDELTVEDQNILADIFCYDIWSVFIKTYEDMQGDDPQNIVATIIQTLLEIED